MRMLFLVTSLLKRRKLSTAAVILQLVFSIIVFSQLFTYLSNYLFEIRGAQELPAAQAVVLNPYAFEEMDTLRQRLKLEDSLASVDWVRTDSTDPEELNAQLTLYTEGLVQRYRPALSQGVWFDDSPTLQGDAIPAVVTQELGLSLGDEVTIAASSNGRKCTIHVIGILAAPTQYFHPTGRASPKVFSASLVISTQPGILLPEAMAQPMLQLEDDPEYQVQSLYLFLKDHLTESEKDDLYSRLGRTGEIVPMAHLTQVFIQDSWGLISSTFILFVAVWLLSFTGILSSSIMQQEQTAYLYTVYYLCGMKWKKIGTLEILRIAFIVSITILLSLLCGQMGLLMLHWLTPQQTVLLYLLIFAYASVMLGGVGWVFLHRLIHSDLSQALKSLQNNE